ncbi:hypothetical protein ACH5RR_035514 [Cinchona calisaya]|uniref:Uncharacterized protein n=1 Tax=Cinchona calisaya TaxID=153742 RepID=A0ABD2Y2S4_9GENT
MHEKGGKKVVLISKCTIKPSFPTPDHLHNLKLSFLDQVSSQIYIPRIFFYTHNNRYKGDDHNQFIKRLKISLSDTLTQFYPLAGRLRGNQYIECNDEGVHFFEAQAECNLYQVVEEDHYPSKLNKFLPYKLKIVGDHQPLLAIQVNLFQCGGLAIGVCISHKIADAFSLAMFIKHWAAETRGSSSSDGDNYIMVIKPSFELAKHFPPKYMSLFTPQTADNYTRENLVARRFVFSAPIIEEIRSKLANANRSSSARSPTRVEALSAVIWERFVAANGLEEELQRKVYTLVQVVNMRKRIPSMKLDACFGNISVPASISPSMLKYDEDGVKSTFKSVLVMDFHRQSGSAHWLD